MQKQRYKIEEPESLEVISEELNQLVASGDYPRFNSPCKQTHEITRNFLFPAKLFKYFRRN